MEQERDDRVIFLKDLLFAALYQWRKMIVLAVVLAVIAGAFCGITEWKNISAPLSEVEQQKELALYEDTVMHLQNRIDNTISQIESQEEYIEDSPLMQLDPYHVYEGTVVFTIQTDYQIMPGMTYQNQNNTDAILHAYNTLFYCEPMLRAMADIIDIPTKYMQELIWVSVGTSSTRTLSFSVKYDNAEDAQAMLDAAIRYLEDSQPQIAKEAGEHTFIVSLSSLRERINTDLIETQNSAYTRLETLQNTEKSLNDQLTALEEPQFGMGVSAKKIILFIAVGGILGVFLVAVWACVCHIVGNKVYSGRTLTNRTGIKVLDCIPASETTNPIDRWLRKLEGRCLDQDHVNICAATIRNYCNDTGSVLLAGTCDEAAQADFSSALKEAGVSFNSYGSLLYSAQALAHLPNSDCVLMVIRCGSCTYAQVEKEQQLIADHSKLLGCVLVDG